MLNIKLVIKKSNEVIIEDCLKTKSVEKFLDFILETYKWTIVKMVAIDKIKSSLPFFGKKKEERVNGYTPEAFEAFLSVEEEGELIFENTLKTKDPVTLINWIKSISGNI